MKIREVVVAQLAEWSLLTPEVRCSNHVNGQNFILNMCLLLTVEKTKIKEKRLEMAHLKNLLKTASSHVAMASVVGSNPYLLDD